MSHDPFRFLRRGITLATLILCHACASCTVWNSGQDGTRSLVEDGYQQWSMAVVVWVKWEDTDNNERYNLLINSNIYFAAFRPTEKRLSDMARSPVRCERLPRSVVSSNLAEYGWGPIEYYVENYTVDPEKVDRLAELGVGDLIGQILKEYVRGGWFPGAGYRALDREEQKALLGLFIRNGFVVEKGDYFSFWLRDLSDWKSPFRFREEREGARTDGVKSEEGPGQTECLD